MGAGGRRAGPGAGAGLLVGLAALLGAAQPAAGARPARGGSPGQCSGQEYAGPGGASYSYCEALRDGPAAWGALDPAWGSCSGELGLQSPIDVRLEQPCTNPFTAGAVGDMVQVPAGGTPFEPNFGSAGYNGVYPAFSCAAGEGEGGCASLHLESSAAPSGSARATYQLQQFHFHSPSENLLNGRQFFLEMHMVFALAEAVGYAPDASHGGGGWPQNAVLAVFFEDHSLPHREERGASGALKDLWALWERPKPGQQLRVDLRKLTDASSDFAAFEGSLTTPPCTSGVGWVVQTRAVGADPALFETYYKDAIGGWPGNTRPVQDLAGRGVGGSFC